jgi:hypothetical protein
MKSGTASECESGNVELTIELPEDWFKLLCTLGDPDEVLLRLADHAQEGIARPGAWERAWLQQVFVELT